jgi:pimeloyl-ACP methyl ester carboxylesterase
VAPALSTVLEVAEVLVAATVVIVAVGIASYAFGSFLLMARHVGARELRPSLRELGREVWIAALTQPMLPLFYVVGYRMDGFFARRGREGLARIAVKPSGERGAPSDGQAIATVEAAGRSGDVPIVFVHGYMQNRVGFLGLARALAPRGVGPMFGFNYPWFASIASNASRLDRFVGKICDETGAAAVDLVCHSMGGLVAMEMMRAEARHEALKVRRCVTIATPHAGVMWRGPLLGIGAASLRRGSKLLEAQAGAKLSVPTLSVYSTHDNVVHPKESSSLALRGGRDLEIDGPGHLAILFAPEVAEHVAAFLGEPDPV